MRSPSRILLLVLAAATSAQAILIRADRDDAEYLELATRYPSSLALGVPDGEGTLIAPRWILTAAHKARAIEEQGPRYRLVAGTRAHEVQAVYIHPDWKKGNHADIALLLLREPVQGIEPTPIYRGRDEAGKVVRIVGHGFTGRIGEKPAKENWDRKMRAAINTVDRVASHTFALRIKGPDEASDLQGASAPGDSGGPAFVETPEGIFVAGVGYATDDANADGTAGNVGDWDLFVRVSAFAPWIDEVMWRVATERR